jgi:type II secretion system protein I
MRTRPGNRTAPKQSGFTLIEVLVALVILGIGIGSILAAYSGSLRLMQRARDHSVAGLLARSKLDETLATENGEVADDGREERYNGTLFGYRITTTPVDLISEELAEKLPGAPRLEEVRVEVFWGEEDRQQRYVMSSFRTARPQAPKQP